MGPIRQQKPFILPALPRPIPCVSALATLMMAACSAPAQSMIESAGETSARETATSATPSSHQRPDSAQRVLRLFDFEELETNPAPVPRYWYRGQEDRAAGRVRDGFPNWNEAELDYETAFRGKGSLKLPTRGGSTSLVLERGVLPIFPTADYLVSSKIMTRGLKHAGAAIVARLLDRAGKVIEGSEYRSALTRSEGAWRDASLQIIGGHKDAGFLELELVLLQPAQYDPTRVRAAGGDRMDLTGSAWFDDVRVAQMPRIELAMTQNSGVVLAPQKPELTFVIRDLTGEKLDMRLQVRDDAGRVASESFHSMQSGAREISLQPDLKTFGWYRARVDVSANEVWVGAAEIDFVWMPPLRRLLPADSVGGNRVEAFLGSTHRRHFAVVTDTLPTAHAAELASLIVHSGAGGATFPVWSPALTPDELPNLLRDIGVMMNALGAGDVEVTLGMPVVPEWVRRGRTTGMWTVFDAPESEWMPVLEPLLDRFGQSARRWQIGGVDSADAPALGPQLPLRVDRIGDVLGRLVPGPIVTSPFSSLDSPMQMNTSRSLQAVIASVGSDVPASSMGSLAESWRTSGADTVTFALPRLDEADYGARAVVSDAARRVIELWAQWTSDSSTRSRQDASISETTETTDGPPKRVAPTIVAALREPWRISEGLRPRLMPRPEIAAWRTLSERLADRRVVGELSIGRRSLPGGSGRIRCLILAPSENASPDRGGALVAWNQSAEPEDAVIRAPLGGAGIRIVDIYGNETPARTEQPPLVREGDAPPAPLTVVPLTDMPVFIEGIDLNLVLFLASFRIEPDLLLSTNQTHEHEMVFQNPWEEGLNGRLWIIRPNVSPSPIEGMERVWKISPRSSRFAVAPMAEGRVPIRIAFDPAEEAGPKDFEVEFELTAGRQYGRVRVTSVVELGLKDLRLDLTCRLGPGPTGPDVILEAVITNIGSRDVDGDVSAFAPDLPRERARISGLAPGNQTVRRFVFPGAAANLRGKQIIVSLAEANSGARLNRSTNVP